MPRARNRHVFFFFIILISADSTIEPGARRCVKRIYKSTTVIYTRRTTLSLKKNLAWRVRTRLCACTCEVFLRAHIFVDRAFLAAARRGTRRFSALLSFFDCIFIALSIDPLSSAISRPLEAALARTIYHDDTSTTKRSDIAD